VVSWVDFRGAVFEVDADFSDFRFGTALFDDATFEGEADFRNSRFTDEASFQGATFEQAVTFAKTVFACPATFAYTAGEAEDQGARRRETVFNGWADFRRVGFEAGAEFGGASFASRARLGHATFGTANQRAGGSFEGARFARARTVGPILVWGELGLDRAAFEAPVRISISAESVSCVGTIFLSRATLEIRFGDVSLAHSEFAYPSIVEGSEARLQNYDADQPLDDTALAAALDRDPEVDWKPRIRSVRRANVANLTLADADLEHCCFEGAHNLDGLRFEGVDFAHTSGRGTRRRMIAEERDPKVPRDRLARTYRALRKGREDNKDEPGAADFYYGEMEMRRQAKRKQSDPHGATRTSSWEWAILYAYRAVSGYGLRASRAVLALAATVALFAIGFDLWPGFKPDQQFGKALLFSAESTSSLFRAPSAPKGASLTDAGHVLQMGLRLLGPLFFGLAILALRGRVKR
jgi:uncharacterized protein YjbI with pentapeptide repeats